MPINLSRQIDDLTRRLEFISAELGTHAERLTRLEAREELFTPFTLVHELFTQLRSEFSTFREEMVRQHSNLSHHTDTVIRLAEDIEDIEEKFAELLRDVTSHSTDSTTLAMSVKDLAAQVEKALQELAELKRPRKGWFTSLSDFTKRIGLVEKALASILAAAGSLWAIIEFWDRYGRPIVHAVGEAVRHGK